MGALQAAAGLLHAVAQAERLGHVFVYGAACAWEE